MRRRELAVSFHWVRLRSRPPWPAEPLPFAAGTTRATAANRAAYFDRAGAQLLYGNRRAHFVPANKVDFDDEFELVGMELLDVDSALLAGEALAILHLSYTGGAMPAALRRLGSAASRQRLEKLFQHRVDVLPVTHFSSAFITSAKLPLPALYDASSDQGWSPADQWLWALASRTDPSSYPPRTGADLISSKRLPLSADWECLVLRDGAAFVGLTEDSGGDEEFFRYGELYYRSLYVDIFALGLVQLRCLERASESVFGVLSDRSFRERLDHLETAIAMFRSTYWRRSFTRHEVGSRLLEAFQREHELVTRFEEIIATVSDCNALVQRGHERQISAALGLLAIVGLPLSTMLDILQVLELSGWWTLLVGFSVVAIICLVLLQTKYGRLVLESLRRSRRE